MMLVVDMPDEEAAALVIYRCATCGKWSHAKRNPKNHERFISEENASADGRGLVEGLPVLRIEQGWTDPHSGDSRPGGWWVRCGPFEAYQAVPVP